jgi:hypothetical protein
MESYAENANKTKNKEKEAEEEPSEISLGVAETDKLVSTLLNVIYSRTQRKEAKHGTRGAIGIKFHRISMLRVRRRLI